jgi:hypothetical protein
MFFTATKRNPIRRKLFHRSIRVLALAVCMAVGVFPFALAESGAGSAGLSGVIATAEGAPLADVSVALSQNGRPAATAVTDENGLYAFAGLAGGAYNVTLTLPEGTDADLWTQVGVVKEEDGFSVRGVTLSAGVTQSLDFTATLLCAVHGTIQKDGAPVSGVELTLTAEDGTVLSALTDDTGAYAFTGLAAGTYGLSLPLSDTETVAAVNGEAVPAAETYEETVTLAGGETREDALALATVSAIRGTAAYLGEGQNVAIASVSAQLSAQTAQDGSFAFLGLAAGDYTVYLPLPVGATLAEGSAWRVTDQGDMLWLTVSVAAGESFALPAAEVKLATGVSGVAYMDDNGSGGYDEGEQLMSGVPVALASEGTGGWWGGAPAPPPPGRGENV